MPGNSRIEYVEPTSVEEAKEQRKLITEQIADISQQLAKRKAERARKFIERHPDGVKTGADITPEERQENSAFYTWRKKALTALRARERALRQYNEWLTQHHRPEFDEDTHEMLEGVYQLLLQLKDEAVDFDPEEWNLVERLGTYLGIKQEQAA